MLAGLPQRSLRATSVIIIIIIIVIIIILMFAKQQRQELPRGGCSGVIFFFIPEETFHDKHTFLSAPLEGGDTVEALDSLFTPAMNYQGEVYMSAVTESKTLDYVEWR